MLHHTVLLQLNTGVGDGGAGGSNAPPKVLVLWKFGQNPRKLGKISEYLHKIPENLSKTLKIWAKMAPKITWRVFFGSHFLLWIFFRASLRRFEQKFFAPQKICLLLHRCSWVNKGDVTRLRHKYYWNGEILVTSSIIPYLKIRWQDPI